MNFRYKLNQFFYGRYLSYGIDLLNRILVITCVVLSVINMFIGSLLIYLLQTALLVWMIARLLSKNISKRQAENSKLINLLGKIKGYFSLKKRIHNDRLTHIYKKCPHCAVLLRLPKKTGEHNVNCPRCKNSFKVKVR